MEVTPTTYTITEYTLKLSAADAELLRTDPYGFADQVRDQLLPHLPSTAAAPKNKPGKRSQISFGRSKAVKTSTPKAGTGGSLEKVDCPDCHQLVARKFLPRHRQLKHAIAAAAESSSSE